MGSRPAMSRLFPVTWSTTLEWLNLFASTSTTTTADITKMVTTATVTLVAVITAAVSPRLGVFDVVFASMSVVVGSVYCHIHIIIHNHSTLCGSLTIIASTL